MTQLWSLARATSKPVRVSILPKLRLTMSMSTNEAPWHAAYPAPRQKDPKTISQESVLRMIKEQQAQVFASDGARYILVDLRRTDHTGGTIRGSINLPAQSLYPSISSLYSVFKSAGVLKVIWYCGSSRGRGTRAAGWFQDHIDEQGDAQMESLVLEGGIKGWVAGGKDFTDVMDEYQEAEWKS